MEKFTWKKFNEININDTFFDSLKSDYTEFPIWFKGKSEVGEEALVYHDDLGISSFIYLKNENEEIELTDKILPKKNRIKIGTFRLAERVRGKRLGEGALGVSLWRWQESRFEEIYVTVFDKHEVLIDLFEKFGFVHVGNNNRGERVYIKSRNQINYSNPYTSFPFIDYNNSNAGLIPIEQDYHDRLFPYSTLRGVKNNKKTEEDVAGNGISKVFLAFGRNISYRKKQPLFIYRKYTGEGPKGFKSVVTSFCSLTNQTLVKAGNTSFLDLNSFLNLVRNRAVFNENELINIYHSNEDITVLEMVYNGYFGAGHNITYNELKNGGFFNVYPYNIRYSLDEFEKILEMGDTDVQNVIINKP